MFKFTQRLVFRQGNQPVQKVLQNKNAQLLSKKNKNYLKNLQQKQSSFFSQQQAMNQYNHTEGMRINSSNMDYFNIDMNVFRSNQKYQNPEKVGSGKILTDVLYQPNMTVAQLGELLQADMEMFKRSVKLIGKDNADNTVLSLDEAEILGFEYNCKVLTQEYLNQEQQVKPPVITIMGHVDHGKTTLLDTLRNSHVCDGEFGGITQKIGAFHNVSPDGQRTTYIDTPGHEAFVNMRIRGASSTDMIVLVVSAIEGLQPQTLEVISIAQTNNLPIMVAINKIDVDGADPEAVENQLYEKGGLHLETHGGNVPVIHISAKNNTNIDLLKELILFETELLELKEHFQGNAEASVLESRKCIETGQQSCTIIIQRGTLKVGDYLIIGDEYQKVRQIKDDKQTQLKEAYPSYAVEIQGLKNIVSSGELCFVVDNERKAQLVCARRKWVKEQKQGQVKQISAASSKIKFSTRRERRKFHSGNKELIKKKFDQIEEKFLEKIEFYEEIQLERDLETSEMDELVRAKVDLDMHREYVQSMVEQEKINPNAINLMLKAVDFGTKETLVAQIFQLVSKFPEVEFNLISSGVGSITENDIKEASLCSANIIAMDVNASNEAIKLAKQEGVDIKTHRIIYSIMDDLKQLLNKANNVDKVELLPMGNGVVKNVFKVKAGKGKNAFRLVAGLNVTKGNFTKKYCYTVRRGTQIVGEQIEIANLKHFKNEVNEIKKGEECGIIFFDFNDVQPGDQIEAYEINDYEGQI